MTVVKTAKIGDVTVGRIGHGLMMMTWRDPTHPLPDEDAFEAIKAGVDAMPEGVKMFLVSGEFYGPDASTANLELLSRFYAKYPEYAEKTFLSVKGGTKANSIIPHNSRRINLRRSVDTINEKLGGIKKMDLFECARVPGNASIEDVIKTLAKLKDEGKFTHIGMSECSAATLRRGHSVHPIAVVEIEVSLWSYEDETKKGFLTGTIKSPKDIPAGDMRHRFTRFQEDAFNHNMALVEEVKSMAEKKGITTGQLALAWVASRGDHVIPIPGSSYKKRNLENIAAGDVELTPAELEAVDAILAKTPIKGGRYNDALDPKMLHLWG
ncbi:aldo/keto reductase [Lentinus tigrinus ALCF2SS1-7]|uniref:Aldo/keto reductase n=1 Tax=Lentinus tigrinus ALCF2SS1-6 TaxID=1328759 RepID=A0A5C2SR12_9APHY|nr:aldo/keto reductase [Lentinus tigrinus ALCF2SS1-6]RPD80205.1 aldo/keto reductase [Lentinus tigrinus ALCF2SS1-7]